MTYGDPPPAQVHYFVPPWWGPPQQLAATGTSPYAFVAHAGRGEPCGCQEGKTGRRAAGGQAPEDRFGAPLYPPLSWFDPLDPSEPVDKVQVTDDGQVRGYWWTKGSCLLDGSGDCWQPQPSPTGYAAFHQGDAEALDDRGQRVMVKVGAVGMDLPHADPYLDPSAAAEHYANTGLQLVVARLGDNEHGGWIAGSLVPEATNEQVARMRRSALSGDWRFFPRLLGKAASGWDSLGPIFVTRPGLPIARSASAGARLAAVGEFGLVAVFGGLGRPWKAYTAATSTAPADAFSKAKGAVQEAYSEHATEGGWQPNPQAKIEHVASTNGVALWRVTDGYGQWYFAGNQDGVVWLCQKMPDVSAYAANEKVYPLTKKDVAAMGWEDDAWQAWLIERINEQRPKGAGVYNTGDSPLVTIEKEDPMDALKKATEKVAPPADKGADLVAPPVPAGDGLPIRASTLAAVLAAVDENAADEKAVKAMWDAHLVTFNFPPDAGVEAPEVELIGMAADGTKVWEVANSRGRWYFAGSADSETGIRWLVQVMVDYSSVTPAPGMPTIPDALATKVYDVAGWRQWVVEAMNQNTVLSESQGTTQEAPMTTNAAAVTAAEGDVVTIAAGDTVSVEGRDGTFLVVAVASMPDGATYAVLDDGSGVPIEQCSKVDMPEELAGQDMGDGMDMGAMLTSAITELRSAASRFTTARTAADDPNAPPVDPMSGVNEKLDAILAALGSLTEVLGGSQPKPAPAQPAKAAEDASADEELTELAAALLVS